MPVLAIFKKVPGITKYKPLLQFVVKAMLLYLAFLVLKAIHRVLIDPANDFIISSYLREMNVYSFFADTIIYPSKWMLSLLGYDTMISERTIWIVGARSIIIHAPCLGFNVISAFIALIVAYPGKVKPRAKFLFILSGVLIIHLLNILRVSALAIKNKYSYELSINHHDLFNIIIYSFVLMAFYFWITYYSKPFVDVTKE